MPRGDKRLTINPPIKGLKTDMPSHLVPDGYFIDGLNVVPRDMTLQTRAGFGRISDGADPFSSAGLGVLAFTDQNGTALKAWAVSAAKVSEWNGSAWTDRTGGVDLTGSSDNQARMALFQTTTTTRTIMTNNADSPQLLTAGSNRAAVAGLNGVGKAKDVTVAFQRAILGNLEISGTRAPSTIVISEKDDPDSFPALNRVDFSDTNDTIVAVRGLNTQSFAIYKDNSVWIGSGAPEIFPFTFELRAIVPGPVSPSSVVQVYGDHYYLGQDGMIYKFDGQQVHPIGMNVYRTIQRELDQNKASRVHGFFDRTDGEIWWFFNSLNYDAGASFPASAIAYNVRTESFSSLCRFGKRFSASAEWKTNTAVTWSSLSTYTWGGATFASTYPTWDSFPGVLRLEGLVIAENGRPYAFGEATLDDGSTIATNFELPLRDYTGDGRRIRVDAVESYWEKTNEARTMEVVLKTTDTLATNGEEQPGLVGPFDLNIDSRKKQTYHDETARWVTVQHRVPASRGGDAFKGVTLYLYDRGES